MFKNKFNKGLNNNDGFTLIAVFITIIVLVTLGFAFITQAISEIKRSENKYRETQAYYYSRSGSERAFLEIADGLENDAPDKFQNFSWNLEDNISYNTSQYDKIKVDLTIYDQDDNILTVSGLNVDNMNQIEKIEVNSRGKFKDAVTNRASYILTSSSPNLKKLDIYDAPEPGNYPVGTPTFQDENLVKGNSGVLDCSGSPYEFNSDFVAGGGPGNSLKQNCESFEITVQDTISFDNTYIKQGKKSGDNSKGIQIKRNNHMRINADKSFFHMPIELGKDSKICFFPSSEPEDIEEDDLVLYFAKGVEYDGEVVVQAGAYELPEEGICIPFDDSKNIYDWDQKWGIEGDQ
jgi:hypothetical protein